MQVTHAIASTTYYGRLVVNMHVGQGKFTPAIHASSTLNLVQHLTFSLTNTLSGWSVIEEDVKNNLKASI